MTIVPDFDLTQYTTFHVPAQTRWFAEYGTIDELRSILSDSRFNGMPLLHIGGGSNLLFTKPFDGLVLHSAMTGMSRRDISPTETILEAESGLNWDKFVRRSISEGLFGLENLAYIPGEVGASAVQNIGAYGVEAKDFIHSVSTIDTASGNERVFTRDDCRYAYRDSMFKHSAGKYIVTKVAYMLSRTEKYTLDYGPLKQLASAPGLTASKIYDKVVEIRRSKLPEPSELGSAGSFFKNPVVTVDKFNHLKSAHPDMPGYETPAGVKIPAGWLIEQAGLKGHRIGGAEVYPKQCLVITNTGSATALDIINLYTFIQNTIERLYGIRLEPEANII